MNTHAKNPYIGPRTFRRDEGALFFGRDREARDLAALVASEKLVLFYAQSGAGKSSLINTRLIPELEQMLYEVLPVARLSGELPEGVEVKNIFAYNLIRSLLQRETDPIILSNLSLSQFLKKLNTDENGYFYDQSLPTSLRATMEISTWSRALIIDQFEEIFSTHAEAWQKREDFFCQLAQAMREDPCLWVVLVMREDYIAALDPYAHLLPEGLRVRYYMQRLGHEAAIQAIRKPVEELRPYAAGVAEKLVEDLSRVKILKPDGTISFETGQYIEPVQLQVVCYSLWKGLPPNGREITDQDIKEVGDVNQSLGKYYAGRVKSVAKRKNCKERTIREWFEKRLIAPGGVRNMVLQEQNKTGDGLDDDVIQALQSDLVRAENRGGAIFYELTHDRLVEPILKNNEEWRKKNTSLVQQQAALWDQENRPDGLLLTGTALREAEKWVVANSDDLNDTERKFLDSCIKLEKKELSKQRRIRSTIITAIAILVVMSLLTSYALVQRNSAVVAASTAKAAQSTAQANAQAAIIAQAAAQSAQIAAEKQEIIARAGELAAQATYMRDENFPVSLLLGIESYSKFDSPTTRGALLDSLQAYPRLAQYLSQQNGNVTDAVFNPDGNILAAASCGKSNELDQCTKGEVILWDMERNIPIGPPLVGNHSLVNSLAFSPDGKTLASASCETYDAPYQCPQSEIIFWDVESQQPVGQPFKVNPGNITSLAYSPDGQFLASAVCEKIDPNYYSCLQGRIVLLNVASQQTYDLPMTGHPPISIAISPDGKTLASGTEDGKIVLWDTVNRSMIGQPLVGNRGSVKTVTFSPDGQTLASGSCGKYNESGFCNEGEIILWNIGDPTVPTQLATLAGQGDYVTGVAFSPDGKTLASGSWDKTIQLWAVAGHKPIGLPLTGHTGDVTSLTFRPDGKTLASGSGDKNVILWNLGNDLPIGQVIDTGNQVYSLAYSPDGKTIASADNQKEIVLWDAKSRQQIGQPLLGHGDNVNSIAFSPDGRILASGSTDKTVMLWDIATHQPIGQPLTGHGDIVNSLAFSPDGKVVASGSWDKSIIIWNATTHEKLAQLQGHNGHVIGLAFSPDGRMLASASCGKFKSVDCIQGEIILWDVSNPAVPVQLATLSGHRDYVSSVAFSPDGRTLASGSQDKTILLWDVVSHKPIGQPFIGHNDYVYSVAFSPDGRTLASGSSDQTVILWDVETHQPIGQPLNGHNAAVVSVAFSPDGNTLASGSWDHKIILWENDPQVWMAKACQRVGRNFTQAEWAQFFPEEAYRLTCPEWPAGE